jgi:hypothetical protein
VLDPARSTATFKEHAGSTTRIEERSGVYHVDEAGCAISSGMHLDFAAALRRDK